MLTVHFKSVLLRTEFRGSESRWCAESQFSVHYEGEHKEPSVKMPVEIQPTVYSTNALKLKGRGFLEGQTLACFVSDWYLPKILSLLLP